MVIRRDVAAELAYLGATNMPRSISVGQFAFASLLKAGSLKKTMEERYPLITPEMEDFYPMAIAITQRLITHKGTLRRTALSSLPKCGESQLSLAVGLIPGRLSKAS